MKTNKIALFALLLIAMAFTIVAFIGDKKTKPAATAANGFALIELFTSEGCSSCPPADELVAKIQKENTGKPIYILAYHVDYWNQLGWKDQFSNPAYSQRQRQYASWLKLSEVYTPQIVVNGKKEFVGSDEDALRSAIQTSLQKTDNNELVLSNTHIDHSELSLQYQTKGSNLTLMIAFVQRNGLTQVKRGENSGKTLAHINIVKALNSLALHQVNGSTTVKLPEGFNLQTWDIVGFTQNTTTGEILGAQKIMVQGV